MYKFSYQKIKLLKFLFLLISFNLIFSSSFSQNFINFQASTNVSDSVYLNINGNLYNDYGGIINNNGNIFLLGNFENNNIFSSGNASVVKLYGNQQKIGGYFPTIFNDLIIDGTNDKTLSIKSSIANSLIFNSNNLILGNNNIELLPNALIYGADNNKFIVTNGNGYLRKHIVPTGSEILFPVGTEPNSLNYKPIILNYSGISDTFSVRVEPGPTPEIGISKPECVQYTYIVKTDNENTLNAKLNLGWNKNLIDEGQLFTEELAKLWQFDGRIWNAINGPVGSNIGTNGTDKEYHSLESSINSFYGDKSRFIIKDDNESELFIPDAFSPNDDGENDVLYVRGYGIKDLKFIIYDRWGERVFESNSQKQGWDGSFKGTKLSPAVFTYLVNVTYYSGKKITKKGSVTLIR